ncbi:phosphate acyltransferase PlsX [Parasphingopyxis marina]|uniref:Phosphate acyltransferase n=1 Tax=Parasphingopyxis marina TaxID=2761622 RepID=A0A842I1E4_9SPHN|nr:phosphate acyltransferase PlsX [Parasphingopyxis marina]MBC2779062.1 phosphate acyltransferase PlsX [Parasphingopyxis marina]
MTQSPRIAIDAMGGDVGPEVMVAGAALSRAAFPEIRFTFFGDEARIRSELSKHKALARNVEIIHSDEVISGEAKPSQALRRSKDSSMGLAIAAVKAGEADAALSGGNTGALMAIAKVALRTMEGIDRPALSALMPTLGDNDVVMLDLGANTECDAENLVQFAVMGAAYARVVLDIERPRTALLNIGSEDEKGTGMLKDAAARLRAADTLPLDFTGFIEADRLSRGHVDVVATDGFSGNIAIKAVEGTARFVADLIRQAFTSSLRSKAGFMLSRPAAKLLKNTLDPNFHNGGVFLGLNGLVVKSHGGADANGVRNAIGVAAKMAIADITRKIASDLENFPKQAIEDAAE